MDALSTPTQSLTETMTTSLFLGQQGELAHIKFLMSLHRLPLQETSTSCSAMANAIRNIEELRTRNQIGVGESVGEVIEQSIGLCFRSDLLLRTPDESEMSDFYSQNFLPNLEDARMFYKLYEPNIPFSRGRVVSLLLHTIKATDEMRATIANMVNNEKNKIDVHPEWNRLLDQLEAAWKK